MGKRMVVTDYGHVFDLDAVVAIIHDSSEPDVSYIALSGTNSRPLMEGAPAEVAARLGIRIANLPEVARVREPLKIEVGGVYEGRPNKMGERRRRTVKRIVNEWGIDEVCYESPTGNQYRTFLDVFAKWADRRVDEGASE